MFRIYGFGFQCSGVRLQGSEDRKQRTENRKKLKPVIIELHLVASDYFYLSSVICPL